MQCMSINDWFEKITGGESYNAVAKKAGVQASSIWRQLPDRLSEKNAVAEHLTKDAGVIEDYQATDNRETSSDHENIDIDAWADRIKAEDSIHNN